MAGSDAEDESVSCVPRRALLLLEESFALDCNIVKSID